MLCLVINRPLPPLCGVITGKGICDVSYVIWQKVKFDGILKTL